MSGDLKIIEVSQLATFETSKAELIAFVSDYENLVVTPETFEEAKKARAALKAKRVEISKIAKRNTDALNDLKNQNWANEAAMIGEIEPTENKIDEGIKAIEQIKANEKAEKERLEREAVAAEIKTEQERLAKAENERLAAIEVAQKLEAERLAAERAEFEAKQRAQDERDAARKEMEALQSKRYAELLPYITADNRIDLSKLWELTEQDYGVILKDKKTAKEKIDAKVKAEREKIEADKQAIEIEKAKIEAAAKEKADAEAKAKSAAEKAEKDKADALAKAEKEKQEAIAELECKQKEKEAADLKAKQDAEAKAEADRLAAIEADLGKADKEKFDTICQDLEGIKAKYEFKSKKHKALSVQVNEFIDKIIIQIQQTK